jgi:hypothetical protein
MWCEGSEFRYEWNTEKKKWDNVNVIPVASDERFVKDSFFVSVIEKFLNFFEPISTVSISTDNYIYHVNFCYPARHTVIALKLRGYALALILTYNEYVYTDTDKYSAGWSLRIDTTLDSEWDTLAEETGHARHSPNVLHGRLCGWSSSSWGEDALTTNRVWNADMNSPLSIEDLYDSVVSMLDGFGPYLSSGLIKDCLPTWEPNYCFADCEKEFWGKFDVSKLNTVIENTNYIQRKLN